MQIGGVSSTAGAVEDLALILRTFGACAAVAAHLHQIQSVVIHAVKLRLLGSVRRCGADRHVHVRLRAPLPAALVHKCGDPLVCHFLDALPHCRLPAFYAGYCLACRLVQRIQKLLLIRQLCRVIDGLMRCVPGLVPHDGVHHVHRFSGLPGVGFQCPCHRVLNRCVRAVQDAVQHHLPESRFQILQGAEHTGLQGVLQHPGYVLHVLGDRPQVFTIQCSQLRKHLYLPLSRWHVRLFCGQKGCNIRKQIRLQPRIQIRQPLAQLHQFKPGHPHHRPSDHPQTARIPTARMRSAQAPAGLYPHRT